ncbi:hypothetical protein DL89DRAFT_296056 [Linderina pennispora]|uniref:Uncharacterized protein n=1 Tax=Linderina pennispora TaxID=61395 RepID=A0A1Y1VWE8_9FUNG|nr:uncharacterized protein DL89DRAFT_296056 [Linderina pennispora]ORX65618.1 hypothetical protein DL89DRAFT_296056 [Linderina pennispora]
MAGQTTARATRDRGGYSMRNAADGYDVYESGLVVDDDLATDDGDMGDIFGDGEDEAAGTVKGGLDEVFEPCELEAKENDTDRMQMRVPQQGSELLRTPDRGGDRKETTWFVRAADVMVEPILRWLLVAEPQAEQGRLFKHADFAKQSRFLAAVLSLCQTRECYQHDDIWKLYATLTQQFRGFLSCRPPAHDKPLLRRLRGETNTLRGYPDDALAPRWRA